MRIGRSFRSGDREAAGAEAQIQRDEHVGLPLPEHVHPHHSGVRHASFGEGTVIDAEGAGAHARVQVNFETAGPKWLVVAYANLAPL